MRAALDHAEDDAHGLRLAWAVTNLPAVGLAVAGGMLMAFARSSGAPLPAAERRAIVDTACRKAARPAGGAR